MQMKPKEVEISMMDVALLYAKRGWSVFPAFSVDEKGHCRCGKPDCSSPGKHPVTPRGVKQATRDEKIIRRHWTKGPNHNIAIAAGEPSGLLIVDIDPAHDGADSLAELERQYG